MAERIETSAAPQETLVRDLSSRVQSVASLVLEDAEVKSWKELEQHLSGKVVIEGKEMLYRLEGKLFADRTRVASISLVEDLGKSAKISGFSLLVTPTFKIMSDESLLGRIFGLSDYIEEIRLNFEEGASFDYRAGTKASGTAIRSELTIINKRGRLALEQVYQSGLLTNPELKGPCFYGGITGGVKDEEFAFVIVVSAENNVKGEKVEALVIREFTPTAEDGQRVYYGETLESRTVMDLPEPFRVNPEANEQTKRQKGRVLAGRINRYLPNQFTEQQVGQIFGNILEGKIFCAGVWNPLEITGARRVSKKGR